MNTNKTYHILNIVTVITVAMFFSCNNNYNQVKKLGISENEPIGVAEDINLKYTDSGRVKANLLGAKMLDYSNRAFSYNEFLDGVTLYLYDANNRKTTVVSDYAIVYNKTDLIDLQGHVVITTHDGRILNTEQLYYDNRKEWLFTNVPVTFRSEKNIIKGNGFDSNFNSKSNATNAEVLEVTAILPIKD